MNVLSSTIGVLLLCTAASNVGAQQSVPEQPPQELSEAEMRERYEKSMSYMLRRAEIVRALAAEHLVFMDENATKPEVHLVEEASQVIAYDVVCTDDVINAEGLHHIATSSTYKIAVLAGNSPIVAKLSEIGQQQPIRDRMNLLGDIATTVFMHKIGRRRGLFDSLITDFGTQKFCDGMRENMRDRFNALSTENQ